MGESTGGGWTDDGDETLSTSKGEKPQLLIEGEGDKKFVVHKSKGKTKGEAEKKASGGPETATRIEEAAGRGRNPDEKRGEGGKKSQKNQGTIKQREVAEKTGKEGTHRTQSEKTPQFQHPVGRVKGREIRKPFREKPPVQRGEK